ncbi:flavin-containing monooxygenase [Perlucidibaca piscinae]|uniref:flavin-containing monooxygenase n=1 Tax=Perlucidibaca piscinae TaxID=392589 RepID=UPI0003FCBD14|nr:NAD(P)/FAD-dependent oxidoreductase [Perlucidibaca piscinae]
MNAEVKIPAARPRKAKASPADVAVCEVLIIGAGFGGLGAAIRLRQKGITDIIILERADEVGGTWRDNTYPGAACDIPSNLYSYSFAPNPDWSRAYSCSGEILDYARHLADSNDLRPLIRFGRTVSEASFDDIAGHWLVTTSQGEQFRGRSLVMASGGLANPSLPKIPGIDSFEGKRIHSARWDHDYDLTGKRIAVIGTGASAIQIIPELVKVAEKVTVFQRTPGWVMPRMDYRSPEWSKALFRAVPATQSLLRKALYWGHESMAFSFIWSTPMTRVVERISAAFLRHQVSDPWLRRQLTPDFRIGCKRVLMSSEYYPALQKPNCKLITWPIATISPKGIRTAEGVEHQVDCIVFATGFDICKAGTPFTIRGLQGRVLAEEWARGAQAYKSVNVSGYPNLSFILGPNSGPGHNSALVYMESQIGYIVGSICRLREQGLKLLDVRPEVQRQYNRAIQKRLARTNWNSGCKSWYLTEDGYNATMYPGFATQYAVQMGHFNPKHYRAETV